MYFSAYTLNEKGAFYVVAIVLCGVEVCRRVRFDVLADAIGIAEEFDPVVGTFAKLKAVDKVLEIMPLEACGDGSVLQLPEPMRPAGFGPHGDWDCGDHGDTV